MKRLSRIFALAPIALIRLYQLLLRPHLAGSCKFYPTCSDYALEALRSHGLPKGTWLATRRIMRCHPFGCGGLDPVPQSGPTDGDTPNKLKSP